MKNILIILIGLSFTSCLKSKDTIIKGLVTGIPASKVYLVDARKWKVRLDSAIYADGKFKFMIKNNKEPFLASILYLDKNKKIIKLIFRNNELSLKNGEVGTSAFMLDEGTINIYGDFSGAHAINDAKMLKIESGLQNAFYQKYMSNNIGYLDTTNPKIHEKNLNKIKFLVSKNPYSFFLLQEIMNNKDGYSKNELKVVLSLFDRNVRNSTLASKLTEYLVNRPNAGDLTNSLNLRDENGILNQDINRKKKLNMLIFWASWCMPCRSEIPQLKKIREAFNSSDFYMASISIDIDSMDWQKALNKDKMDWDQFAVVSSDLEKVKAQYNFSAIPLVVFTDKSGKEIKRFAGYKEKNIMEYKKIIEKSLAN